MKKKTPLAEVLSQNREARVSVIRISDQFYRVPLYPGAPTQAVVESIRRDAEWELVCTRSRDFGGLGKDALKPEIVPVGVWLAEIYATEICEEEAEKLGKQND